MGAIVGVVALSGEDRPPPPPPNALPSPPPRPEEPRAIVLPLPRVTSITRLGPAEACALGGREVACTRDGGATWTAFDPLPAHALAVVRTGDTLLVATSDGAIRAITDDGRSEPRLSTRDALVVADAAGRDGVLYLLAHRYAEPADELRLPLVATTELLVVDARGELERRARLPGFAGERLLVHPDGSLAIWALLQDDAYRSTDGGFTFQRLTGADQLAARVGELLLAVERRLVRLPERRAHAASSLVRSRDGGASWEEIFSSEGELVVGFASAQRGLVIARDEAAAYFTDDGGASFALLHRDDRLEATVDVAYLDGRWLAVTDDGIAFLLPAPAPG